MKVIKKALCLVLTFLCLLSVFPISTFAAESLEIDVSTVESDFKAWGIETLKFPKNVDDTNLYLMHMLEYGYDEKGDMRNYGIYLYIYNPCGIAIEDSDLNKVQMTILDSNGEQLRYSKYGLEIISASEHQGKEDVFYKFKVKNVKTFVSNLDKSKRQYKISGLELLRSDNATADGLAPEYRVDSHYIWTGYQAFYNKLRTTISTLYYERYDMDVIETQLFPATWMTDTSDLGPGHHYEIFSVYFAVDNYFIRKYGNPDDDTSGLRRVSGEYEEYLLDCFISDNKDAVAAFDKLEGYTVGERSWLSLDEDTRKYCFYNLIGYTGTLLDKYYDHSVSYAYKHGGGLGEYKLTSDSGSLTKIYSQSSIISNRLALSLYSKDSYITRELFKYSWINNNKSYSEKYGMTDYDVKTSDGNLNESIKSFASTREIESDISNWWHKLWNKELWSDADGYPDIEPIVRVDKDTVLANSVEANGEKYFMNKESAEAFTSYVRKQIGKDNTVYVMRFAVRDYFSTDVSVQSRFNKNEGTILPEKYDSYFEDSNNYFVRRSVFDKFDIMEMEFEDKTGAKSVLPVAATPITVTGGIISPNVSDPNDPGKDDNNGKSLLATVFEWWSNLNLVFKILIGVTAAVVLLWLLRLLWKGVGWLIVGIGSGIGSIFGFTERRIDRYRERVDHKEDRLWKSEEEARKSEEHGWKRNREGRESERFKWAKKTVNVLKNSARKTTRKSKNNK